MKILSSISRRYTSGIAFTVGVSLDASPLHCSVILASIIYVLLFQLINSTRLLDLSLFSISNLSERENDFTMYLVFPINIGSMFPAKSGQFLLA